MSKHIVRAASSQAAWLRLYAAVAVLPLALAACGGGGGSSPPPPAPTPAPSPAATLAVTPSATTTTPGGASVTLNAVVTNSTAVPTWTLSGPGALSASSGTSIQYVPPASGSLDANATVTISAALTGATTQTVTITVTVPATAGLNWTNVTASSIGNLQAVDYADGRYVAVSDQGAALASTDAVTWTPTTLFTSNVSTDHLNAYAITHLGNTYVAAGSTSSAPYTTSTGAVASSSDGMTWTMGTLPAGATPIHAMIAGTRLVGLGESGHLYSSSNGTAWSLLTTVSGAGTLNAGVYGGGKYVGVGDNGYILASNDSVAWQSGQVITNSGGAGINLHGIAYTGALFVAVGDNGAISTSPDGSTWSALRTSPVTGTLRSVAVSATGVIVVVGDNGIETSVDGVTWISRDPAGAAALNGVTFANGQFVAVGASSAIKTSVATN
jgi:hypothetical protein